MLQDPRSLLQLAEERRRSGRLKEAIAVCLEGLTRHPNLDAVRVTLGRSYLESGQTAEARDTLREVYSRQPDHHLAGKLLAEAQKRLGDLEGAAATCREILRHYPRDRELEVLLSSVEPASAEAAKAAGPPAAPAGGSPAASDPSPDYLPEDVAAAGPAPTRVAELPTAPAPNRNAEVATSPSPARSAEVASGPAPAPRVEGAPGPPARREVAPGPVPARRVEPEARASGDALQTNTLAELYVKQGLVDRALEVYRGMSRLDPANESLRRRIMELERSDAGPAAPASLAAPSPVVTSAPAAAPRAAVSSPAATSARSPSAPSQSAAPAMEGKPSAGGPGGGGARERAAIERLERWLDAISGGSEGRGRAGASR